MGNKTPLFATHQAMGGKIVDFGGWDMPLHYGSQIEEHNKVRQHAGMFDVSHMTVIDVHGVDAKAYLQYLLANDVAKLDGLVGKALYSGMLRHDGGVIDDLIVYNMDSFYRVVVNCSTREKDLAWMTEVASAFSVTLTERTDLAMIAVQGPKALVLAKSIMTPEQSAIVDSLSVFQGLPIGDWFIARTGYTGEDGLEICVPNEAAEIVWRALADAGVALCGLAARDTLRLEAGMNLYGHEMDESISPLAANMGWTIAWSPESRAFIGRDALEAQRAANDQMKLVGLVLRERGVLRADQVVTVSEDAPKGVITSGTFSPTLGYSIGLARVPRSVGTECTVDIRGKAIRVDVVKPSFVRNGKALV